MTKTITRLLTIYFIHIGESYKPLGSLVLSFQEPDSTDLIEIIGESLWRYASVFILPEKELEQIESIVETYFSEGEQLSERVLHYYGTFEIIVVRPRTKYSVVLNTDKSILAFQTILKKISPSQQNLHNYLRNLLHRLGFDIS